MIVDIKLDIYLLDTTKKNISKSVKALEINSEIGLAYEKGYIEVFDMAISERLNDGVERVFVKIDGVETAYVIEDIEYNIPSIKIYFVPKIANFLKKERVFDDISLYDFHAFLDHIGADRDVINFNLASDNKTKTYLDRLNEFCKVCGAEYYSKNGNLFVSKPKIQMNGRYVDDDYVDDYYLHDPITIRSEEIQALNRNEVQQPEIYDGIGINVNGEANITTKPTMTLSIDPSPQPFSPSSQVVYVDGDNTYYINPVRATAKLYFSPYVANQTPKMHSIPINMSFLLQKVVGKFKLKNQAIFFVTSNIQQLIAVEVDGVDITAQCTYEQGYNAINLHESIEGELKVAYSSYIYIGKIPTSTKNREYYFDLSHFDQELEYTHNYKPEGYFPEPYTWEVDFITDLDVDPNDAVYMSYSIGGTNFTTDAFGYAEVTFNDYGVYSLSFLGRNRWIVYYANRFSIEDSPPEAT